MNLRFSVIAVLILLVGVCSARYSGGTGEPNDPYRIATAVDLNDIGNHVEDYNKCFVMVADINLVEFADSEFNIIARDTNDSDSGFQGTPFTGVFDGNGYVISNLTIDAPTVDFVGLFGYIGELGEVRNLGIDDINFTGGDSSTYLGGLCGENYYGTISNCYATGEVNGYGSLGGLCGENFYGNITNCYAMVTVNGVRTLGGLCGENRYGTIANCYATGAVGGEGRSSTLGGLCGENDNGTITNCYATGAVNGFRSFGGLCGYNRAGVITKCYSTGVVSGGDDSERLGGLCGDNSGTITGCFWDMETSGLTVSNGGMGLQTLQMQMMAYFGSSGWGDGSWTLDEGVDYPHLAWENASGVIIVSPEETLVGDGTAEEPWRISDIRDLLSVSQMADFWGDHYIVTSDIDMNGLIFTGAVIAPDTSGSGSFDGTVFAGVFDGNGHTISNLIINTASDSDTSNDDTGYLSLFGYIGVGGELKNIGIEDSNVSGGGNSHSIGSLCGQNYGTITNCYTTGAASGTMFVGGMCGYNGGTIMSCCASDTVSVGSDSIGYDNGPLGGLCGSNGGTITDSYATGDVNVGVYCYGIGGLCGKNHGMITNCYAIGSVSNTREVGGLCGGNNGTISKCYFAGSVVGDYYVGGLCGDNSGTIGKCYSIGSVIGNHHVGGFCGDNDGMISDCYSTGSATGSEYVGGLSGRNWDGTIGNCYCMGSVTGGGDYVGGLLGENNGGSYKPSFWNSEYNPDVNGIGNGSDPNVISKTTAEMQMESTFADYGWDFVGETVNGPDDIWDICEGTNHPRLVWSIPQGDLLCPDGVDFIDYTYFADVWNTPDPNADFDLSGLVDPNDLRIFCDYWLEGQ